MNLITQVVNIIIKIMFPKYFDNKFTLCLVLSFIRESNLNGICNIKNDATNKLLKFKLCALFIFPFDNSQNALVVPQTGHSTPNNLSIKQKCGIKFKKSINVFLNKIKIEMIKRLLINIFMSFCRK
jgi:hypothetical protein